MALTQINSAGLNINADTASGDDAAVGYTSAEGLIITGQGSTSDVTLKNDADGTVFTVPTGTDDILFPDSAKGMWGAGSDMQLYHDGSNSYITNAVGALKIATETSGIALTIGHTTSETTVADNLTVTGTLTSGAITSTAAFTLGSGSQFTEIARGTEDEAANNTFFTIHSVGGTEDGVWRVFSSSSDARLTTPGYTHYQDITFMKGDSGNAQACSRLAGDSADCTWSTDNMQIKQATGITVDVDWVIYKVHIVEA